MLLILLPLCPSDPFLDLHSLSHSCSDSVISQLLLPCSLLSVFSLASLPLHSFYTQYDRFIIPSPYVKPSMVSNCMQNTVQTLTHTKFLCDLVPALPLRPHLLPTPTSYTIALSFSHTQLLVNPWTSHILS